MSELAIFGGAPTISDPWPKWPRAYARDRELIEEVLNSSIWGGTGLGPKIRELNEKFAHYCDVKYGAAVANGTVSMELLLAAWGIGPGDEVVVPSLTFMATAIAVHHVGATVVYADIDPATANLDPAAFEAVITGKTKAVIPVHIGGHPADMDPIVEIARKHGIKVIEDAAQAQGALYKGRKVGSVGDAGSFSFQQSKNMQSGEGGFITCNDRELIDLIHYSLGKFGRGIREKYSGHIHYNFGWNACYSEIHAAIALAQFERLDEENAIRVDRAKKLYSALAGIEGIELMTWQPYCDRHAHHLFLFRFIGDRFDGVTRAQFLAALNKEASIGSTLYPMPLYEQPLYAKEKNLSMRKTDSPVAAQACREICILEQNVLLDKPEKMDRIAGAVRKIRAHADELRTLTVSDDEFSGSAILKQARETAGKDSGINVAKS